MAEIIKSYLNNFVNSFKVIKKINQHTTNSFQNKKTDDNPRFCIITANSKSNRRKTNINGQMF